MADYNPSLYTLGGEAESRIEPSSLSPRCRSRCSTAEQHIMHRPKSNFVQARNFPLPTVKAEEPILRSYSLSRSPVFCRSVAEMAEELLDSPIELRHKKAIIVFMEPSDLSDADKLKSMLTSHHSKATNAVVPEPSSCDKVVEVIQHAELSPENPTLVEAVISRYSPQKRSCSLKPEKVKTHQQIKAVLFEELKRKVMRALLMQEKGSATQAYPLSVFIKAQNALLCRDLVSLFLMGTNSLYLFIYNWKEEPVLVNKPGEPGIFLKEILKWIHTIGSTASSAVPIPSPRPPVSAMVVMTNFEELVSKSAGEHQAARKIGNASTHKLCEQLQGHPCATFLESKPILLNFVKESKGHSCESKEADVLMEKLADSNFPSQSVDPRWVHLLCEICERNHQPVLQIEDYLSLARNVKLVEEEAFSALSFFKEAKLVFFLPRSSQSELQNVIFTDMEWLVNTLVRLLTPPSFSDRGRLWGDWEQLRKNGIMSESIKTDIEQRAMSNIDQLKLPSQWVFMLLHEVNLFTALSSEDRCKFFCPLYLCDEQDDTSEADQSADCDYVIPPLYLRPTTGCVTDQYTMRLSCYIISSGILSLQEAQSRTHAIFLCKKHNLRFTLSCRMDCLKIEVESSFTGRSPFDDEEAPKVAQKLVHSIVRASEEMGNTWYPVLLSSDTEEMKAQHPNQYFQCCDIKCSHYCKRPAPSTHLSKVVYSPKGLHLECEESGQCRDITKEELFWIDKSFMQVRNIAFHLILLIL